MKCCREGCNDSNSDGEGHSLLDKPGKEIIQPVVLNAINHLSKGHDLEFVTFKSLSNFNIFVF